MAEKWAIGGRSEVGTIAAIGEAQRLAALVWDNDDEEEVWRDSGKSEGKDS